MPQTYSRTLTDLSHGQAVIVNVTLQVSNIGAQQTQPSCLHGVGRVIDLLQGNSKKSTHIGCS